jgi:hypothetical protein
MALARFQSTAVDRRGNVIAGASVTVRSQETGFLASIFSDRAGTIALDNPFSTDVNGAFGFHVGGGTYRIEISDGSNTSEITWVGIGRVQENEAIVVDSNNNVGIGTSSPNSYGNTTTVTIQGEPYAEIDFKSAEGDAAYIYSERSGGTVYLVLDAATSSGLLSFAAAFSERMRITSAGNVGIGTSSPNSYGDTTTLTIQGPDFAELDLKSAAGDAAYIYGGRSGSTGYLALESEGSTGHVYLGAGFSERMRITSAGNVGIGTSSPDASSILDITSTTGGVLFPRMTTTQRDAISSPANGLVLYNTTTNKLQVRAGGSWVDLH